VGPVGRVGWPDNSRRSGALRGGDAVGLSARSLSGYENGHQEPGPGTLRRLASALDVPVGFLTAGDVDEIPTDAISFRAPSELTAGQRDTAGRGQPGRGQRRVGDRPGGRPSPLSRGYVRAPRGADWVGHAARCLVCRPFSAWPPAEPRGHLSVYEALQ
jgi:transcriptional regulator with XRE-family HTH domain